MELWSIGRYFSFLGRSALVNLFTGSRKAENRIFLLITQLVVNAIDLHPDEAEDRFALTDSLCRYIAPHLSEISLSMLCKSGSTFSFGTHV